MARSDDADTPPGGPPRRLELVAPAGPGRAESARVGAGLLVGLVVGRSSLMGAATGSEQFEVAIGHFVGLVLICVAGALVIGGAYDRARIESSRRLVDSAAAGERPGNEPAPGLPIEAGEAGSGPDPAVGSRP